MAIEILVEVILSFFVFCLINDFIYLRFVTVLLLCCKLVQNAAFIAYTVHNVNKCVSANYNEIIDFNVGSSLILVL